MPFVATTPIPVRLDPSVITRLDGAAKRLGTNRSALIKFCAQTFLSHFERHGGVTSLPPNWRELLSRLDGRRNQVIQFSSTNSGHISQSMAAQSPPKYRAKKKGKK
jgi:hypothetical protein